jgi:hypothetical protein
VDGQLGGLLTVAFIGGIIAAAIAYSRSGQQRSYWVAFWILGFLLPVVGIVLACLVKRPVPAPQPPGWYPDPWRQAASRYYDGAQWTYHTGR